MKEILIVEDNADMSSNIEYILSKQGYSVFVANTGAAGIAMAKAKIPDLIIMDIILPDIQGGGRGGCDQKISFLPGYPCYFSYQFNVRCRKKGWQRYDKCRW